jgi:GGDEF domain-containing protein
MRERRTDPGRAKLPPEFDQSGPAAEGPLREPGTGFYSMPALYEFIRYEIDGGLQTETNERFVTPVCLAALGIDALPSLPDDATRSRLVETVADALRKMTRRSDRLTRSGSDFVVLLRRTLASRARDFYGPHVGAWVAAAAGKAGLPTTVSVGIASLTEHLVKGPEDMLTKAFAALAQARKQGPGHVVVYDFRVMPY